MILSALDVRNKAPLPQCTPINVWSSSACIGRKKGSWAPFSVSYGGSLCVWVYKMAFGVQGTPGPAWIKWPKLVLGDRRQESARQVCNGMYNLCICFLTKKGVIYPEISASVCVWKIQLKNDIMLWWNVLRSGFCLLIKLYICDQCPFSYRLRCIARGIVAIWEKRCKSQMGVHWSQ